MPTLIIDRNHKYPFSPINFSAARFSNYCKAGGRRGLNSLAAQGLHYQDLVARNLARDLSKDWFVIDEPWIEYYINGRWRLAGPDILLVNYRDGYIVVVECKLSHVDCYTQVWKYMALVRKMFPLRLWRVVGIEIHKYSRMCDYSGDFEWIIDKKIKKGMLAGLSWDGMKEPKIGVLTGTSLIL